MSQSIVMSGVYRNNKRNTVGLHNPVNNRTANEKEFNPLFEMYKKHLFPISEKFKRIDIVVYLQSGKKVPCITLDDAVSLIKNDTIKVN